MRLLLTHAVRLVPWRARRIIKDLPLVGPVQRALVARLLAGRPFVHTVDAGPARGLRFMVTLPEDKGVWTGGYELPFARALAEAVVPGDVCFDVGGWRGFFAGVMALAGARRVYVFEPSPVNGPRIQQLITLNPKLPIEHLAVAVGEEGGDAKFELMPESSMGKLSTSPFQPDARGQNQVEVKVVSLDELVATRRVEAPRVLKIDIEGAEAMALRGARRVLSEAKPRVLMEVHSEALLFECRALLEGHGYLVQPLTQGGMRTDGVSHLRADPRLAGGRRDRRV